MRQLGKMAIKSLMVMASAVVGVAGVMAPGGVDEAQAGAKAFADLEIIDATITNTDGTQLSAADFSTVEAADTGNISGALSGFGNFVDPNVNVDACIGDTCGAINGDLFSMNDFSAGHHFSRAANLLSGTFITAGGVDADTAAEVILSGTSSGLSQSVVGTIATFTFAVSTNQAIVIDFDAVLMLYVELHQEDGVVLASSAWSIEIRGPSDEEILSWTPDGALDAGDATCADLAGCLEIADDFDLSTSRGLLNLLGPTEVNTGIGNFTVQTGVLSANVLYTLTIFHEVNVTATATKVPEPTTLGLFGIGLLGLGLMGWRRRRETAA